VYKPFGEVYKDFNSAGITIGNPSQDGIVWEVPFRFPGQYQDPEDELYNNIYYNWHRWYMPGFGRYNRADPVLNREGSTLFYRSLLTEPIKFNLYLYARNNPCIFSDPLGVPPFNWTDLKVN